ALVWGTPKRRLFGTAGIYRTARRWASRTADILPNRGAAAYGAPPSGSRKLRVIAYVLLGIAAVTTILSLIGANVDLAVAGLFFDRKIGKFLIHYGTALSEVR